MSTRDAIEREFIRKFDPWIPYEGPYGGAGWQNVNTGEIRYQEAKPGTGEAEGEEPTTYSEVTGEEAHEPPPDTAKEVGTYFDEGDVVELDGELWDQEEPVEAQIDEIDDNGWAWVDDPAEEGTFPLEPDYMSEESQQEYFSEPPGGGWADGWSERPEDPEELTSGQKVEVYDFKHGDYVVATVEEAGEEGIQGRVTATEEWSPEGTSYEAGDQVRTDIDDYWVTAQEDVTALEHADKLPEDELLNLQEGDEVYYNDPHRAGLVEAEVASDPEMTDEGVEVEILDEDDLPVTISTDEGYNPFFEEPTEIVEPSEVPLVDLEDPEASYWPSLEGTEGVWDHPLHGQVEGEMEFGEDAADGEWLAITPQPDPEDLEEGDRFWFKDNEYVVDLNDSYALDTEKVEEDKEVSWDKDHPTYDELKENIEGEPVSASLNPEHPHFFGEVAQGVEQPYQPIDSVEADDLKIGDTLVDEETNSAVQIEQVGPEGSVRTAGGEWVDPEELDVQMDYVQTAEGHDPPDHWDGDEWLNPMHVDEHGNVEPRDIYEDDTVYWYDEEAEELKTGQVSNAMDGPEGDDFEVLGADGPVAREQMQGVADTGIPIDENYELWEIGQGEQITIQRYDYTNDEVEEIEAYVTALSEDVHGVSEVRAMTKEGDEIGLDPDKENMAISDRSRHVSADDFFEQSGDWEDHSVEELADDLYSQIHTADHGNYISKLGVLPIEEVIEFLFDKNDQANIRSELMTRFPPETVNNFYKGINQHKQGGKEGTWGEEIEAAFKHALDIEERVRHTSPDKEHPRPSDEMVKLAGVAAEMSQWYYEDHIGPSVDSRLSRDASTTSFKSFLLEWADNPDAEEFGIDGRATNKFQTTDDFTEFSNFWRISPDDVPTGDVALATDFMFNPMETHSHENEIWLTTAETTVSPEDIGVGPDKRMMGEDHGFGGNIEEWSEYQTEQVATAISQHYEDLTTDEQEVFRPDELSDQQVETFLDLVNHAEDLGVTKSEYEVEELHDIVTSEAQARGMLEVTEETLPTGISSIEDFQEGMQVRANDMGEEQPFVVEEVLPDGTLNLRNYDTDKLGTFEPSQVTEIVEADEPYGPAEQAGEFGVEDFTPGKQAYFWTLGGSLEEVTVLGVDEEKQNVEISRESGMNDTVGVDRVVPGDADLGAEGSEDALVTDPEEVSEGDQVKIETSWDDEPIIAEVENITDDGTLDVYSVNESAEYNNYNVLPEDIVTDGEDDGESIDDLQADTDAAAMSASAAAADYEEGDPIGVEWPTIDETAVGEVVEVSETIGGDPAVTVSYEIDGNQQTTTIIEGSDQNLVPTADEGSDEPATITGPEDVEEGMAVRWTSSMPDEGEGSPFDGPDDGSLGQVKNISESGVQVYDEQGNPHALDWEQVQAVEEPEDFGGIKNGFDSIEEIEEEMPDVTDTFADDPTVEYLDPETGEVEEAEMTATFPSMDAVHIAGVEEPVPADHVRPSEGSEEAEVVDDLTPEEEPDGPVQSPHGIDYGEMVEVDGEGEGEVIGWGTDAAGTLYDVEHPDGEQSIGVPAEDINAEGSEEADDVDIQEAIDEQLEEIMPDEAMQEPEGEPGVPENVVEEAVDKLNSEADLETYDGPAEDINPVDAVASFIDSGAANEAAEEVKSGPESGFTFPNTLDPDYDLWDQDYWLVGVASENIDLEEEGLTSGDLPRFYEEWAEVFSEYPSAKFGGFHFPEGGKVSLDVSISVEDEEEAKQLAEETNQHSIFNPKVADESGWDEGEIVIGGDGESPVSDPQDIRDLLSDVDTLTKGVKSMTKQNRDRLFVSDEGKTLTFEEIALTAMKTDKTVEDHEEGVLLDGVLFRPKEADQ